MTQLRLHKVSTVWLAATSAAGLVVAFVAYVSWSHDPPARNEQPAPAPPPFDADAIEPWCADGLEAIPGGGCFAPARGSPSPAPMLVYLHGRYSPDTVNEELDRQARVARLGATRGFAVLALHGQQGECNTPELKDWWCWPSNERNQNDGPAFVARWTSAIEAARKRIGAGSNVLLGFSNGGYFAALIATRALLPFDAIAIAHGGPVEPTTPLGRAVPLLLITADDDASDPEMQRLDDELRAASWPHALVAREGGHALPDWDVDVALTFFTRVRTETLPFSSPLPTRSPRPRVIVDASTEPESFAAAEAGEIAPPQPLDDEGGT